MCRAQSSCADRLNGESARPGAGLDFDSIAPTVPGMSNPDEAPSVNPPENPSRTDNPDGTPKENPSGGAPQEH